MPTTRKKVIKTVYKDEDSEPEKDGHDFSDSGSDAVITDHYSSDEECQGSSDDDFKSTKKSKAKLQSTTKKINKTSFTKSFISKINKQQDTEENLDIAPVLFSVKDLSDADKLLPSVLNLSESDSSDDESPTVIKTKKTSPSVIPENPENLEDDIGTESEYKDVWSQNVQDDSEEIAKKTFLELEQHKSKIEETKASIQNYSVKMNTQAECDVKDLLALGEEEIPQPSSSSSSKKRKKKVTKDDTDSEMEDWEEVKEVKAIPQQGLQLIVDIPNAACRKTKKVDVEMMMRRKINRVKKEYQVYMHKVHVLSWLGHGNYVSGVLNDQSILAAALSLVPSKECYPGERVDIKYITQITSWFKDKVTLKQDKNENKFRPKAPPLIDILQQQIKSRVFTTKKYIVFVYVSMLRSLGLQCRVMFNFVTVPIKPPSSELCSLTSKPNVKVEDKAKQTVKGKIKKEVSKKPLKTSKNSIPQLDGNNDMSCSSDSDNIMQVDGSDDGLTNRTRRQRNCVSQNSKKHLNSNIETDLTENSVSPPKRARRNYKKDDKNKKQINAEISPPKSEQNVNTTTSIEQSQKSLKLNRPQTQNEQVNQKDQTIVDSIEQGRMSRRSRNTKNSVNTALSKSESHLKTKKNNDKVPKNPSVEIPQVVVTNESNENLDVSSAYFENDPSKPCLKTYGPSRKRSKTTETIPQIQKETNSDKRARTRSAQNSTESKYFADNHTNKTRNKKKQVENHFEDSKRVSHRDLNKKINRKNDVTSDLIHIIKERVKEAKADTKKLIVKEKRYKDSDDDSDHLPVQSPKRKISESDDDFKPSKISPKPKLSSKKVDRRVLSTDDESLHNINKTDVWCEVFVEELEEWIAVDVIKGNVHCVNEIYNRASHPVTYAVGWDNNNYLKDLTRKYVPHWNTVTRKQRAEPPWWDAAVKPWLGPPSVRDREEDERLDRMQLEAPLPKSIAEYKNHPLYALKRHLLKFEAIYPPDAPALGFVRGEAVYSRDCVYVCRSRDTWLKEAKVVKLAQEPYKVVKARPKWDKLSNKLITDKPLEVFGPWQVKDYVPPVAVNGVVPRNAYGNVELFKECMLPGGTVHLKLPGLNRVAKKYNIDCAPAMTGFDFNGGWSHPVYDGFVVCKEFEEVITEAWLKDQEDQERREQEKIETRVYGNWRRLIRGLLIKEKLKAKYGFEEPSTSQEKKKKGPRLVVKKK